MAKVREIFISIQGEGPYVGSRQLFIRFCGCNLNCNYCDTDFDVLKSKEYSAQELLDEISKYNELFTISLTGGEPLVSVDFLKVFLHLLKTAGHKVYLETNGTLPDNLARVINDVDIISADIKLESATGIKMDVEKYKRFFEIGAVKEIFAKVVFNENITEEEIFSAIEIAKAADCEIILQPEMKGNQFAVSADRRLKVFEKFYCLYKKVRLIPQVHKFLDVE